MNRRNLGIVLVCLLLAGCGSAAPASHPRPAAQRRDAPAAARPCLRPAVIAPGTVVRAWRMGSAAFHSPLQGVGVTAPAIWCDVSLGRNGSEGTRVPQTVMLAVTHDGGAHWSTVGTQPPGATLTKVTGGASDQVVASSARRVWLLTASGHVLATASGGARWTTLPLPVPAVQIALTQHELWVLSCRPLGGQVPRCRLTLERMALSTGRWTRLLLPQHVSAPDPQMSVPSDRTAVIFTSFGAQYLRPLLATSDRGRRWMERALPHWHGRPCSVPSGIATANPRVWWFLCIGGAGAGSSAKALFRTTDAGRTWTIMSAVDSITEPQRRGAIPLTEPDALAAGSSSRLWLALTFGLAESADAGTTWQSTRSVNTQGDAATFNVLSSTQAWLVASGAGMWRTTDGTHWSALGPVHTS